MWGSQPWGQELDALMNEPARHPVLFQILMGILPMLKLTGKDWLRVSGLE